MLIKFHQDRVKTRGVIKLQRSLRSGRAGPGRAGPGRNFFLLVSTGFDPK